MELLLIQPEWWHWIVGGVVLVLAELLIPSFFVIWFGLGALLVGVVLLFIGLPLTAQIALWSINSIAMTVLWFRVFRHSTRTQSGTADGEVIGEVGILVDQLTPFQKANVRFQRPLMGADVWVCLSDQTIAAGERVRVVAVEGSYFRVVKQ